MQRFLEMVEEARKNIVKSDLQIKLEADGWEFLTNHRTKSQFTDKLALSTDQELKDYYLKMYKEVFITEAYDLKAELLTNARAIYVRRTI